MASQSDRLSPQAPHPIRQPFDAVAVQYDHQFSETTLGGWYRNRVWSVYGASFEPGDQILELGCGTGEDAIWLANQGMRITATDASEAMLKLARQKAQAAGKHLHIKFLTFDLNSAQFSWPTPADGSLFDGIAANFGVLNCVQDRQALATATADSIRPGGKLVMTVMGPVCSWEIGWHVLRGDLKRAVRRFRSGAQAHVGGGAWIRVWYPSAWRVAKEFSPAFDVETVEGVGILLPPPYFERWVDARPALFNRLRKLDQQIATKRPWRWLADHYTIALRKK